MKRAPQAGLAARTPGQRAGVTTAIVLECASRLAALEGVDAVTMRRLAAALRVAPNTIYSHFDSKTAILDAVLDGILSQIEVTSADDTTWQNALTMMLCASRDAMLRQPSLLPVFAARPGGANALRLGDGMLHALAAGGIHGPAAVTAMRTLLTYMIGSAMIQSPRDHEPEPAARASRVLALIESTSASDSPIHELSAHVVSKPDAQEFEQGLRWLLQGIAWSGAAVAEC
jgi:AcrR family transcriptional regulator